MFSHMGVIMFQITPSSSFATSVWQVTIQHKKMSSESSVDNNKWWSNITNRLVIQTLFRKHAPTQSVSDSIKNEELGSLLADLGFTQKFKESLSDNSTIDLKSTTTSTTPNDSVCMFSSDELHALLLLIDEDMSNTIEFEEFYKWWAKICGDGVSVLMKNLRALTYAYLIFSKYDVDRSGYLDVDEMAGVYGELFAAESADLTLEELLEILDQDGDGKISFRELTSTLQII